MLDPEDIRLEGSPILNTVGSDPESTAEVRKTVASEIQFLKAQKFDEKSAESVDVFTAVRPALRRNPRQYLRFFNTLRFENYLDSLDPPNMPPKERLLFLAKRVVLFLEWPDLWAFVVGQSDSFENLIRAMEKGDTQFEKFLRGLYDVPEESNETPKRCVELIADKRLKELLGAKLPQSAATQ